ncbi:MAG: hypothetical protein M3552_03625 [Planctomycetota bacterium]|nr:hypothetical protein [Planctomycetaceae bacterium]MDQ3329731.1 hypothetical protein [Planctomycetota bacterium]
MKSLIATWHHYGFKDEPTRLPRRGSLDASGVGDRIAEHGRLTHADR